MRRISTEISGQTQAIDSRRVVPRSKCHEAKSTYREDSTSISQVQSCIPVDPEVCTFDKLIKLEYPLALDNYQRPYVWDDVKIQQLVDDLLTFQKQGNTAPDYYMGTLLLHRDEINKKRFVIDGQQRLSSLFVLHYVLRNGQMPHNVEFKYRSVTSIQNLQRAQKVLQLQAAGKLDPELLERLCFTVITVASEDLAFTFFDTQNNRGVPLKATDLLKAFHLRAINSKDSKLDKDLQKHCACRWESIQVRGEEGRKCNENDFVPELFHYYLWRARNWRGQKFIEGERHDDLLLTFQKQSVKPGSVKDVPLYPGISNRFATGLSLLSNDEFRLALQPLDVSSSAARLPFALRQPIHQGLGFFLYAQKYAALLNLLLHDANPSHEVSAFRRFYREVVSCLSHYLRELYKLAVLMYIDRLGWNGLLKFALWLDHVLGAIRLEKSYIFKQAPLKYLKESHLNLLDVIAFAYRPDEVFEFLKSDTSASGVYESNKASEVQLGNGVKGRYLKAVLDYYDKTSLDGKIAWMDERVCKEFGRKEECDG